MSLTSNQKEHLIECYDALKNRGLVYLSGAQNGKTRVITRLTESHIEQVGNRTTIRPRHSEDNEVVFVRDAFYLRSDKVTPCVYMRLILKSLGIRPEWGFFELLKQYERILWEDFYKQGKVLCIAVDNAELLCEKSYTVFKYLNEFRRDRKDYGTACVLAGEFGKMRMPIPFLKRTTEIRVGPITAVTDLAQMIETHYPGLASSFHDAALRKINSNYATTLEKRQAVAQVIRKMRTTRSDEVDVDLVNLALAA